ncbi:MAG: 2-phosphosulfolactate phosphatase, partial [bacterium]
GGKSLILTTTNGTLAVKNCLGANSLLMGAFLNLDAVVNKLLRFTEVVLVCAGTENNYSMDDGLCAAWIIHRLKLRVKTELDDLGHHLLEGLNPAQHLTSALKDCHHLNYLVSKGYARDVDYCLQVDIHRVVPVYDDGRIIAS